MNYFKGAELAQMSDGSFCIIRSLGLVKGGKGLRHHETLLALSVGGLASKFAQLLRYGAGFFQTRSVGEMSRARIARSHE
jgi:hypothetical protein